jgi:phosphonate transport system substrate-binding protein
VHRIRRSLALLCLAAASISWTGCKSNANKGGRPTVLRYAFAPNAEQLQSGNVRTVGLRNYLQQQLHMPVEVVRVEGYAPTIEAMRAGKVDLANFGSLGYIIAAKNAGAQAIVSTGDANGKLSVYYSVIAVPKDSPIHSIADLKAHAKDLVFAFADPASTSGNLYPRVFLQSIGIQPEHDFKQVVFANGHLACVMAVKAGKVDAGAFMQSAATRLVTTGKMKADDVRIIWTSEGIPTGPLAVRSALPDSLKLQIQDAMTHISTRDPALWAELAKSIRSLSTGMTYIPVTDATYNGLRHYAEQVKDFNLTDEK